jgi:aryl-alcohol dehydrogenase-like predicted oxidoreductase
MTGKLLAGGILLTGCSIPISALALGTVAYRLAQKEQWFEILDDFRAAGGTLIDTARIYAGGESEQVVGAWLESRATRADVIVLTKCAHGDALLPAAWLVTN